MLDAKEIVVYQAIDGSQPFEDWLTQLKDKKAQARIRGWADILTELARFRCISLF